MGRLFIAQIAFYPPKWQAGSTEKLLNWQKWQAGTLADSAEMT
jgi:hypothetical protein